MGQSAAVQRQVAKGLPDSIPMVLGNKILQHRQSAPHNAAVSPKIRHVTNGDSSWFDDSDSWISLMMPPQFASWYPKRSFRFPDRGPQDEYGWN